jgi:hypothetical protein
MPRIIGRMSVNSWSVTDRRGETMTVANRVIAGFVVCCVLVFAGCGLFDSNSTEPETEPGVVETHHIRYTVTNMDSLLDNQVNILYEANGTHYMLTLMSGNTWERSHVGVSPGTAWISAHWMGRSDDSVLPKGAAMVEIYVDSVKVAEAIGPDSSFSVVETDFAY